MIKDGVESEFSIKDYGACISEINYVCQLTVS